MDGPTEPGDQSLPRPRRPGGLAATGYLATVAALFVVAGPAGVGAALAVAAVGLFAGPLNAFIVGHVVLLAVLPSPPLHLGIAEGGFSVLLLAAAFEETRSRRTVALTGGVFMVLVGVLAITLSAELSLLGVAATLLGVVGAAGYALHRYELVQLGLIEDGEVGQ